MTQAKTDCAPPEPIITKKSETGTSSLPPIEKEKHMDPAFIVLSLWLLGAAVEFLKGNN